MKKTKVIIVGGGLSGLSAAYELSRKEIFDIHLIEKNGRLGGRVNSFIVNGHFIDTGGFLVYPWYKRYKELINVLRLEEELVRVPNVPDYYDAKQNSYDKYFEGFRLSFKDLVEIFVDVFPDELIDTDPTAPNLNAYKYLTINDYLNSLGIKREKANFYLNVICRDIATGRLRNTKWRLWQLLFFKIFCTAMFTLRHIYVMVARFLLMLCRQNW